MSRTRALTRSKENVLTCALLYYRSPFARACDVKLRASEYGRKQEWVSTRHANINIQI